MIKLMLSYGGRADVPVLKLREEVKKALDNQWDRLHLGMVRAHSNVYALSDMLYCADTKCVHA
jgi:hypothetical protein